MWIQLDYFVLSLSTRVYKRISTCIRQDFPILRITKYALKITFY
jgi:hypothetical protein